MLYLTRKIGEEIIIDENIHLKILEIRGGTVKIGFDSPQEVKILRKELYEKIKRENLDSSGSATIIKGIFGGTKKS